MNRARPLVVTKVRQAHAAQPLRRPGVPYNGPNLVAQRPASQKKSARRTAKGKQAAKQATR